MLRKVIHLSVSYTHLKGHQVMLLDVFLGYEHDDWKDVFEKNVDWAASVGAIKDQNPDIDAVKALRPDWKKNFFGPHAVSYTHLDVYKRQQKVLQPVHQQKKTLLQQNLQNKTIHIPSE